MGGGEKTPSGGPARTEYGWTRAYEALARADAAGDLDVHELQRLAVSAYLTGRDAVSAAAWERAHVACLRDGDPQRAARSAFWLILQLMNRGEFARAGGWLGRALRLVEDPLLDCAERGLLLALVARDRLMRRDVASAEEAASEAHEQALRSDDAELRIFGRLAFAQVRARRGDQPAAVALFDEIMVAVTVDDVSPIAVGVAYCAVVDGCHALFDVARAREWTDALARWCAGQPDLVPFRGRCLVHRVEILRLSGAWTEAVAEAEDACRWLIGSARGLETPDTGGSLPAFKYPIGAAFYELAELHRLRGEFERAERAYRRASDHGRPPHTGLALLRLVQGRGEAAAAAIRSVLEEVKGGTARTAALAAAVEILLDVDDVPGARGVAEELAATAERSEALYLRAVAATASGRVLLAEGDSGGALVPLREAWMAWQELEVPYEAARARVLRAIAYEALGDASAAELELAAAERVFERLVAAPDLEQIESRRGVVRRARASPRGRLSRRELEVVGLVATGMSNHAIAEALGISKRTVDRHVSNILLKLDLPSRTAATAYAYEHGLV